MKKILFNIFLVSLLLITSISALAVSNVYTFSADWNKIVFDLATMSNSTSDVDPSIVIAPGLSYKLSDSDDMISFGSDLLFVGSEYSGKSDSSFLVDIPVNLRITNEDTLTWSMWLLINTTLSDASVSAFGITPEGTYVTIDVSAQSYDFARLQTYSLNSFGGVESIETVYSGNTVQNLVLSYDNNATQTLERIQLVISTSAKIDSFVVGALGSQNLVSVPSDVYQLLLDISNKTGLTNSRILSMLTEIRNIYSTLQSMQGTQSDMYGVSAEISNQIDGLIEQLQDVISSLGNSADISTQINNYLTQPSAEQIAITEELTQLVSDAKNELSEIKQVLSTVVVPTVDNIINSNPNGYDSAIGVLSNDDTSTIMDSVFSSDILVNALVMVISIATLGFILYGKKA